MKGDEIKMKIKMKPKAISAILIMLCMLASLLPSTVSAEEDRTVISVVRGSASTADYTPVFGKKAVDPYIMVLQGLPAGFNTIGGNWYRKNADSTATKLEKSDTFTEGTYYFRCKVQISAPDGTEYVLNKDGITAEVNGVNWENDGDVSITDKSSYVWVKSPEHMVKSPYKDIEMSFEPNGGTGTQAPVYTDQYGDITMPECTFTKAGDKFFAWNVDGGLYFPGDPCNITQNTTATALWESSVTKKAAITMEPISEGKTPAEIAFGFDTSKFSVSSVWYEGDKVDKFKKLENTDSLSVNKNYTVRLTMNSTEFLAGRDDLNITVNGKKITNILSRSSNKIIFDVQILNDVGIEFFEPMGGAPLAAPEEITTNSDRFYVSSAGWFPRINAMPGEEISAGTAATLGKKYYLSLTLQSAAENQIFGGDTIKANGKSYKMEERDFASNKDSVIILLEFTTTYPQVRISEDSEGYIIVEAPKDMEATFAAALYDSTGRVIEVKIAQNRSLAKGNNKISPVDIIGSEKIGSYLLRVNGEKVKILVLRSMSSLSPICPAHNYKKNLR